MSIGKVHSQDFYRITVVLYHLHRKKVSLNLWLTEFFIWVTHGMVPFRPWKTERHSEKKNEYQTKLIDKSVNKYLNKKIMNKPSEAEPSKTKENIRCFKLPFIGKFYKFTDSKWQKLTKNFCKEGTNSKMVFSTFKLSSLFSTKRKVPYGPM